MNNKVRQEVSDEAYVLINNYAQIESKNTFVVFTSNPFNILNNQHNIDAIVNLKPVNQYRYINKLFIAVNEKLANDNVFICRFETIQARKSRQKIGNIPFIRNFYFFFEFLTLRIAPKVWGIKKIYFILTRGRLRLLSKAEVLGRLVSTGFDIVEYKSLDGYLYCVVKKVKQPQENYNPSYGPIYAMPRLGKNGKLIKVYKFRTMHPFSEYLN